MHLQFNEMNKTVGRAHRRDRSISMQSSGDHWMHIIFPSHLLWACNSEWKTNAFQTRQRKNGGRCRQIVCIYWRFNGDTEQNNVSVEAAKRASRGWPCATEATFRSKCFQALFYTQAINRSLYYIGWHRSSRRHAYVWETTFFLRAHV